MSYRGKVWVKPRSCDEDAMMVDFIPGGIKFDELKDLILAKRSSRGLPLGGGLQAIYTSDYDPNRMYPDSKDPSKVDPDVIVPTPKAGECGYCAQSPFYFDLLSSHAGSTASVPKSPAGGLEQVQLAAFWSAVVNGDVEISEEDGQPKTYAFSPDSEAKWGPMRGAPNVIVERHEYMRVWNSIQATPNPSVFMIKGTKGIGKSVFLFWLINKIVQNARDASAQQPAAAAAPTTSTPHSSTAEPTTTSSTTSAKVSKLTTTSSITTATQWPLLPTFLLLLGDSNSASTRIYYLLHYDAQGLPIVTPSATAMFADYLFSDVVYDLQTTPKMFNLYVCSYGATDTRRVSDAICNLRSGGVEYVMGVCSLPELEQMLPLHLPQLDFAYAVFGGSARHVCALLYQAPLTRKTPSYGLVFDTMTEFFADSQYASKEHASLIVQTSIRIAIELDKSTQQSGHDAVLTSQEVYHSLFQHIAVVQSEDGFLEEQRDWASAYMRHLGCSIVEFEQKSVLTGLRNILTNAGLGQ